MKTNAPETEIDAQDSDFTPLTAEQAQRLRDKHPEPSPWWVIVAQVVAGVFVAGVLWGWTGRPGVAMSSLYGSLAVAVPAAMFVRGVTRGSRASPPSAALSRFFVWELIKLALTIAFLAAAPWLVGGLSWLALLAGVVTAMQMYWVALLVPSRLLNRI